MASSYTTPQSLCEDRAIIEQRARGELLTQAIRDRRQTRERLRRDERDELLDAPPKK